MDTTNEGQDSIGDFTKDNNRIKFAILAAAISYAIYQIANKAWAEALFVLLNIGIYGVAARGVLEHEYLHQSRNFFVHQIGFISRLLVVVLAVGVTAIIFDYMLTLEIFPDGFDSLIKRLSIPIFIIGVSVYFFSFISYRISNRSKYRHDDFLYRYESIIYFLSIVSAIFLIFFFLGLPIVEEKIEKKTLEAIAVELPIWNAIQIKYIGSILLSTMVWFWAFVFCYLSRHAELCKDDNLYNDGVKSD